MIKRIVVFVIVLLVVALNGDGFGQGLYGADIQDSSSLERIVRYLNWVYGEPDSIQECAINLVTLDNKIFGSEEFFGENSIVLLSGDTLSVANDFCFYAMVVSEIDYLGLFREEFWIAVEEEKVTLEYCQNQPFPIHKSYEVKLSMNILEAADFSLTDFVVKLRGIRKGMFVERCSSSVGARHNEINIRMFENKSIQHFYLGKGVALTELDEYKAYFDLIFALFHERLGTPRK